MPVVPASPDQPPAEWYPDPAGRYTHRYWDGRGWTEHVSTDGRREVDPVGRAQTVTPAVERREPVEAAEQTTPTPALLDALEIPRFGARAKAKELATELQGVVAERNLLLAERERLATLGVLDAAALEDRREMLIEEVAGLEGEVAQQRSDARAEIERLHQQARTSLDHELASGRADCDVLASRLEERCQ